MSSQRATGDIKVDGFGVTISDDARRLDFPRAHIDALRGEAGTIEYRAREVAFDQLRASLARVQWSTESASAGDLVVRDKQGRFELKFARAEFPHGLVLTRAAGGGMELVASHASLADMRLKLPDLSAFHLPTPPTPPPPPPGPPPLRQGKLHFLDAVNGELAFRLKVVLDLPVVGTRTLDQHVKVAIKDGCFDYRALESGLSWLEGQFVDVGIEDGRFQVGWGVPLMATKEIISWALDPAAMMIAVFNRVPLRCLADFRIPESRGRRAGTKDGSGGRQTLRSLAISDVAVKLSMAAPRHVDVGGGAILFGGDDAPGIVDLQVGGGLVHPPGPGALTAAIGVLDMTLKDVRAGGLSGTCDRLHIGPIDKIELVFDGFRPVSLSASLHRVTATNLALVLGGDGA
ncbi:MAG: hypothetical protein IPL61_36005 [Myxococcales bacterium]|nr:hypothetical protein [Myxococcales bacterium]